MINERRAVLKALLALEDGGYSNLLATELFGDGLTPSQKAFSTALMYGVIERKLTLDYYISKLSSVKLQKLEPEILCILRMGLYQIIYMDSVPDSAAVNESVKLAAKKNPRLKGFVNAVLRSFLRKRESITELPCDSIKRLEVMYSCPDRLIKKLISQYGGEACEEILKSSLLPQRIFLKANTERTTAAMLLERLTDDGVKAEICPFDWEFLEASGGGIFKTSAFSDGLFHVQNYSAARAVKALDPKPGERILDICAAPGGKSFTAAEYMKNSGEIVSCDIHPKRAALIEDGAKRLGLDIIKPMVNDAAVFNPNLGEFDGVLCDAPCSGIGVIGSKPEIKYKSSEEVNGLPLLQLKILSGASRYVKAGGRLIYSTCTILKEENEEVAEKFLKENKEFSPDRIFDGDYRLTILPNDGGLHGFFISAFKREK